MQTLKVQLNKTNSKQHHPGDRNKTKTILQQQTYTAKTAKNFGSQFRSLFMVAMANKYIYIKSV